MLTSGTADTRKNAISVSCALCIWCHKYVYIFMLFVYNMYRLCDHTPYCNYYTSDCQL